MVERDLVGNVRLASTDEFLQKLLPMRSDEVLTLSQAVKPEGFLPKDAKKESDLYTPLTQTANRILACYSGALEIHSYWATRPDHSPKHLEDDDTIALLRPDAVCVLGDIRPLLRAREQIDAFKSALKTKSKAVCVLCTRVNRALTVLFAAALPSRGDFRLCRLLHSVATSDATRF